MDRISALRNIEEALRDFESGDSDLAATEQRVVTVLRTYATDFEGEEGLAPYQATGEGRAHGLVVVAESSADARDRIYDLLDEERGSLDFEVERL
ncbi:hypothetical protein C499_10789 [Halogeometricum borinquense DSM 11551]|uniref:Uncharacterized protein n=2 Tax=Halogeometricum borinquense TaxID=60847 RepID=E4NRL0_HALBP|nr:hypothetical protein [Halogeometricum borinquense]ADQ65686.1 hypothetical protein Hbor_00730 [Halogeometricum borinquense DSM 11551]ELY27016.1 hypothetical protein C499_10789 [Halogeometricum borinquense DSM 11551]RYJ15124.1 hypothetical protein ELS19_15005 [Halogeometricum borinquense]